jgi:hypothetical protein
MAPKSAKKPPAKTGRPVSSSNPEAIARRQRYQAAKEGKARARGRPKLTDDVQVRIALHFPEALLKRVDAKRGQVPRAAFIRNAVEKSL